MRYTMLAVIILCIASPAVVLGQKATTRPAQKRPLVAVLDVERESQAYYLAVLGKHRPIHPFGMVARMETQHEQALLNELDARGVAAPADRWRGKTDGVPDTREAALAKAVEMEKKTVAAYERAMARTKDAELKAKLTKLRDESLDHQKWFEHPESCPMGGRGRGGAGPAPGRGRGGQGGGRGPAGGFGPGGGRGGPPIGA